MRTVFLLGWVALLSACGSTDSRAPAIEAGGSGGAPATTTGGAGGVTLRASTFADVYLATGCPGAPPCCQDDGVIYNDAACRLAREDESAAILGDIATDRYEAYDADAGAACIAALAAEATSCAPSADRVTACANVITGTLPMGSACTQPHQCKDGICDPAHGGCIAVPAPADVGASCDDVQVCVATAVCRSGACVAAPDLPAGCSR